MTKYQFLYELDDRLSRLPEEDRDKAIEYYSEMIDDRVEEGIPEAAAVMALGSIDDIYTEVVSSIPLHKLIKLKLNPKSAVGIWKSLLLFFGFLVFGLPIIAVLFSVVVSLYASLWAVAISFFAVTASLAVGGIAGVILFLPTLFIGTSPKALFLLGAGLFSIGLVIPFFYLSKWTFKLAILASKGILLLIKKCLIKRF